MATERTQRIVRTSAILVTLLLTAMLLARGTTQLIASMVLPLAPEESQKTRRLPRSVASAGEEREKSPRELAMAVLTRNMFDSQTGPMTWDPPVTAPPPTEGEGEGNPQMDPDGEPGPCSGPMRLVAALVVPRVPMLSFASIEANGKTLLYRPGMQVEGHELVGIREHRVFLRPSGATLCQIAMFQPPQVAGAAPTSMPSEPAPLPPPATTEVSKPSGGLSEEELNQGITQVSDTSYNVNRSLLDKVLSNQAELMRAARIIPYEENGRVIGVKVYGIRRSSLLGKLGVQNGDVLRTINGFDLSSPDSALEAYTKLREMDQFSIAMMRRGQPRTQEYSVK
jgi:general secretion pathway protein C